MVCFRLAWVFAGLALKLFNKNVSLIVLGDDNAYTVAPLYRSVFNAYTMPDLMAKAGMVYTMETKDKEASQPFRKLSDIEFLKRRFFLKEGVYKAPLRLDVVIDQINWSKRGKQYESITADNLCTSAMELVYHDDETYQKYTPLLLDLYED